MTSSQNNNVITPITGAVNIPSNIIRISFINIKPIENLSSSTILPSSSPSITAAAASSTTTRNQIVNVIPFSQSLTTTQQQQQQKATLTGMPIISTQRRFSCPSRSVASINNQQQQQQQNNILTQPIYSIKSSTIHQLPSSKHPQPLHIQPTTPAALPTQVNSAAVAASVSANNDFMQYQIRRASFSSYSQNSHASDDALVLDANYFDSEDFSPLLLLPDIDIDDEEEEEETGSSSPLKKSVKPLTSYFEDLEFIDNHHQSNENINTTIDESTIVTKHRVGRRCKAKEERSCGVCGDKALSCNFDALSCESCKAFFRRNAARGLDGFTCAHKNNCTITTSTRRSCKKCRLKKCLEIGMKKEYILTNEERFEKKMKIHQNKIIKKLEERGWIDKDLSLSELAQKDLLTESEIALVDEIITAYSASLWVKIDQRSSHLENPDFFDLVNFSEISIRRAIEMFKRIEGFRSLHKQEQIHLLKSGCIELLILRGVAAYDTEKKCFLDAHDSEAFDALSLHDFLLGAGEDTADAFLRLLTMLLDRLHCRQETLLILLLICLFSDRHNPTNDNATTTTTTTTGINGINRQHIAELQHQYLELLRHFLSTTLTIKIADKIFPQILMCLVEVRTINEKMCRRVCELQLVEGISPLMAEMLNVPCLLTSGNLSGTSGGGGGVDGRRGGGTITPTAALTTGGIAGATGGGFINSNNNYPLVAGSSSSSVNLLLPSIPTPPMATNCGQQHMMDCEALSIGGGGGVVDSFDLFGGCSSDISGGIGGGGGGGSLSILPPDLNLNFDFEDLLMEEELK